ncbi:MAG: hypothetical protein DME22_17380 [Verrucomicrobia bacterium]|nr:MAG: hypothetical protein DME22_17380 [Verrucomicrobiota bacterium]PYK00848.1 MAG: hypothetical protein DME23_06035 [Verrucomicrobiota bacterium]
MQQKLDAATKPCERKKVLNAQNNLPDSLVAAFTGPDNYRAANAVFNLVNQTLAALCLPAPFIQPGDRVVLKPNWVKEHDERFPGPDQWEHVVTHPLVIEAVARWAAEKLHNKGSITICDAPQTDSSFAKIRDYCGLDQMLSRLQVVFPKIEFALLDLRPEEWSAIDGVTVSKTRLPGDPSGNTHVRLDSASEFLGYHGQGRLYGASYDMAETNAKHDGKRHEYLLCRTPMDADVFINLPKLKTHKKVGVTCALKNLVGINANKNWLPHHTEGAPDQGGDQFPATTTRARLEHAWMGAAKRWLKDRHAASRLFVPIKKFGRLVFGDTQNVIRSGNWHGNDTCWRMVLDLNKCFFFFDGLGQPRKKPIRYLAVVDGIIAGEGNGPMSPDAKPCGVILAGTHPVAVDCVAATLMGFDWLKLRLLRNSFAIRKMNFVHFQPDKIQVVSNKAGWSGTLDRICGPFNFRPHFGWIGAIESNSPPPEAVPARSRGTRVQS